MKKRCISSLILLILFTSSPLSASQRKDVLDKSQKEFLKKLMRDTWNFIDYACDPVTGIPQNFQYRTGHGTFTNSTPVGLYNRVNVEQLKAPGLLYIKL